jgi:3-dehydroquinate dehydratase II
LAKIIYTMKKVLVIHGPNLQLLGSREPQVYGRTSLSQINAGLRKLARNNKLRLEIVQTNHEGRICDLIGHAKSKFSGILINPAAYTHTSVAVRDAIAGCGLPCVEVHLSNIHNREEFRRNSLISPVAKGTIMGFGPKSYYLGLLALLDII